MARHFKVSNLVIGLTVVAFGSSTPDFVVCLTSTLSGKSQLALGDIVDTNIFDTLLVVGACVFNVFFILGFCATIKPLDTGTISLIDFSTLVVCSLMLWLFGQIIGKRVITRGEGAILLLGYIGYMTYLVLNAVH